MIFDETCKLFVDSRRRGVSGAKKKCAPATIDIYNRNLDVFADFLRGKDVIRYQDLKRMHIVQFLDWLDEKEKTSKWSKATCIQMLRCLRTFFGWIDKDEDCQEDGLKGMQKYLPIIGKSPRRTDIPPVSDLKEFKNTFEVSNRWGFRDYVATCLMLETGIRVGEVCNLQVDAMKLEDLYLIVTGKTGPRPVAITTDMAKLLKGWMRRRESCVTAKGSTNVFVSKYSPRMSENGIGQRFRKHRIKYNLPRITAHTMRHSMATNYLRKGGDMEKLRMMTGHSSYAMLAEYLHLAKVGGKAMQEELEKVSLLKDV